MRLSVADLTVQFDRGGYVVRPLDGLSFEAESGELVLLLGPSGSGKTTLLSCLAGIMRPTSGSIMAGDIDVCSLTGGALAHYRRRTVGIVFQAFNLIPSLTALENVEVPLRLAKVPRAEARERATELLRSVDMGDRLHHRPGALSGGQQQRVAIARGLAHDAPLILADEPTAHLDYIQVEGLLKLIRSLARPGKLVVVATHDDRMVPLADRVIELAPRFAGLSQEPVTRTLAVGEVLFRQGSKSDLIYVIEEGLIEIVRERADGSEEVLATPGVGEYFGELGPLLGFPRSATARAATDARVTGYTVHDFRGRTTIGGALPTLRPANHERARVGLEDPGAPSRIDA